MSRSCPLRYSRTAAFLIGRASGYYLVLDVKRRKASLFSLCPYLDSFRRKPLVLLFARLLCEKSDLQFTRAVWGSGFSRKRVNLILRAIRILRPALSYSE